MDTANQLLRHLQLQPLLQEGGFFAETYRSPARIEPSSLGIEYPSERSLATAIFYLLTPGTMSTLHKLRGDEMYHFYLGGPVEMLQLFPDGSSNVVVLGQDISTA